MATHDSITPAPDERPATPEELAAIFDHQEFPLWGDDCPLPSAEEWMQMHFTLRVMWAMLAKSKPEIFDTASTLWSTDAEGEPPPMITLFEAAKRAREVFAAAEVILGSGEARLLAASAKLLEA